MYIYAIITSTNDEKYERFLKNLNVYHGRVFPANLAQKSPLATLGLQRDEK